MNNREVWKYELQLVDEEQRLDCGKILLIAEQDGRLCVWAENKPCIHHALTVEGTGHPVPDGAEHAGSCQMGPFMWHVYDRIIPPTQISPEGTLLKLKIPELCNVADEVDQPLEASDDWVTFIGARLAQRIYNELC